MGESANDATVDVPEARKTNHPEPPLDSASVVPLSLQYRCLACDLLLAGLIIRCVSPHLRFSYSSHSAPSALLYGTADCVPVLVHQRWSPSTALHIGGTSFCSWHCHFFHSFTDTSLLLGPTTLIGTGCFCKSPILTASCLSTLLNLLSSCITFNLLCSCRRPRGHLRPSDDSQISLRVHTRFSHALCGGARARKTFASLGSALSCVNNGSCAATRWLCNANDFPVSWCRQQLTHSHSQRPGLGAAFRVAAVKAWVTC